MAMRAVWCRELFFVSRESNQRCSFMPVSDYNVIQDVVSKTRSRHV
jgi:hypothetical protein